MKGATAVTIIALGIGLAISSLAQQQPLTPEQAFANDVTRNVQEMIGEQGVALARANAVIKSLNQQLQDAKAKCEPVAKQEPAKK